CAGTGWDVAERMGLTTALRAVRYPVDAMEYIDGCGRPFLRVPLDRIRRALDGKYVSLRRPDLARILYDRAVERGVTVRFGTSIRALHDTGAGGRVTFESDEETTFGLVVGADGIHSNARRLVFGPEGPFARYLGYYVAAFSLLLAPEVRGRFVVYEEPDRVAWFTPLSDDRMDALLVFRTEDLGHVPADDRLPLLRRRYTGAGWIAGP